MHGKLALNLNYPALASGEAMAKVPFTSRLCKAEKFFRSSEIRVAFK
jgi:hypothetical protein